LDGSLDQISTPGPKRSPGWYEFRHARSIQPLIEKVMQISTGNFVSQLFESFGRGRRVLELLSVSGEKLVEVFVADDPLQHTKNIRPPVLDQGTILQRIFIEATGLTDSRGAFVTERLDQRSVNVCLGVDWRKVLLEVKKRSELCHPIDH